MNNRFLQDTSLSLQAKGLLAEILSNKSDWRIYLTELEKRSTNGESSHRAAFSELKRKRYAALFRKSKGYKKGFEIFICVSDIPMTDEFIAYLDKKLSTGSLENSQGENS
jgi:hypothetical protein|nr:MAG: winged helix-turn-helix domain protein [Bacteriophage sp.]